MIRILFLLGFLLFPTLSEAANRFAVCTTTCTWDNVSTAMWSTTTGGGTGASAPTSSDAVILDAATCVGGTTCTITVNANLNIGSITMGACTASTTGCILDFSANNNSVTISFFSGSGTGTRTLNMGSNTFTVTSASGTVWDNTTVANFTFNANTSTILLSATALANRALSLGTKIYNNITVTNAARSDFWVQFTGASTISGNLTLTNLGGVRWPNSITVIITGTITYSGTFANPALFISDGSGVATLSVGAANVLTNVVVQNITKVGSGSISATSSFDAGSNTNVTITAPPAGGRIIGG